MGSCSSFQNAVALARTTRTGDHSTPASAPTSVSAVSAGLAAVETVPTVNGRYSSPSVGARKARFTDARSASDSTTCHSAPSRGLSCVSFCDGNCWVFMPVGVVSSSCPFSSRQWSSRSAGTRVTGPSCSVSCTKTPPESWSPPPFRSSVVAWTPGGGKSRSKDVPEMRWRSAPTSNR